MPDSEKTVLAVDDDLDTLNIITLKLQAHRYKVITARDGEQALRLVRENKPDLIIMDVMMPKVSGLQAARIIKFDAKSKSTPLILLTARTQDTDKSIGMQVGANLYLTKPFDPESLLKEVSNLLGG